MQRHLLALALLAAPALAFGADPAPKVATCDMERVMKGFAEFKAAEELLQKQLEDFRLEQDELQQEGEKLRQEFEAARGESENKALSEAARDKQLEVAKEKLNLIREHEKKVRKVVATRERELSERGMRMRKRIVGKLRDVVKEHAAKKGITLVLDSSALGVNGIEPVLYSLPAYDITEDILKITAAMKPEVGAAAAEPAARGGAAE